MTRLMITFENAEIEKLRSVAQKEFRTTKDQARYFILICLGLIGEEIVESKEQVENAIPGNPNSN